MILADLETDGLLDTVTKVHCCVCYDTETKQTTVFTPDNIDSLCAFLEHIPELCFHNGICFDLAVLKKLYNFTYKGKFRDTLIMSRILWPDLEAPKYYDDKGKEKTAKGAHSIESWGLRFNTLKPEHEDWSQYSPEMLERCRKDVTILSQLYKHIQDYVYTLCVSDSRIKNLDNVWELEQKVAEIIEQQARNGWAFDLELAYKTLERLEATIESTKQELIPQLPLKTVRVSESVCKAFKADKTPTVHASNWCGDNISNLMGDFSKVRFDQMNLNSDVQVKNYLLDIGWEPKEWNHKKDRHGKPERDRYNNLIKTSPKLPKTAEDWAEVAETSHIDSIKLLAEYNKASHRASQIRGFIENLRPDHRIEAQANTCSTNTARMVHRIVVNIPKASSDIYYGKEMRALFKAGEGKVLVGCDASALEARCEAHYVAQFDKNAAMALIEGDIHTANAEILEVSRHVAKTAKYAILYGCSPAKLASTINKPKSQSQEIYDQYWNGNPALKQLKEAVEQAYDTRGYLLAIDGRPLTIRYKHALINTLFQSCGSIIMKKSLVILDDALKASGLIYAFVGNFHDEIQIECSPKDADVIGAMAVDSMIKAGKYFNLNVPMLGEYKIGLNWAETH